MYHMYTLYACTTMQVPVPVLPVASSMDLHCMPACMHHVSDDASRRDRLTYPSCTRVLYLVVIG